MDQDGLGALIEFGASHDVHVSPQQVLLLRSPADTVDIESSPSVAGRLRAALSDILDLPGDGEDAGLLSAAVADVVEGGTVAGVLLRGLLGLEEGLVDDDMSVEVIEVQVVRDRPDGDRSGDAAAGVQVDDPSG